MRNTTDLEKLKELMKTFLRLPLENTEASNLFGIYQHPFFNTGFTMDEDHNLIDITKPENMEKIYPMYDKAIDKISNIYSIILMLQKPYYLTFLKFSKQYLSQEDFSSFLKETWIQTEYPSSDVNVSHKQLIKWFKEADKKHLMDEDELEEFDKLEDTITVYRGVTLGGNPNGMSWTTSLETAEWFAKRFDKDMKKGYIIKGTANKKDVLAYFLGRGEFEIVISNNKVNDKIRL